MVAKVPGAAAITRILDIVVNVGRTGAHPRRPLEPVRIAGAMISRATPQFDESRG
jgi:DNA ligase (NAD+)